MVNARQARHPRKTFESHVEIHTRPGSSVDFAGAVNAASLLKRTPPNVARGIFIDTEQLKFYGGNNGNGNSTQFLYFPQPARGRYFQNATSCAFAADRKL